MKPILAILFSTALLFSENEEIAISEPPSFTSPSLPELQGRELAPLLPKTYKSPGVAVGLSFILPGLGHTYLGDYKTAGGMFASTAAFTTSGILTFDMASLTTAQNLWTYGVYAAYRDARLYNGQNKYLYQMPIDTLSDLSTAPFQWRVLARPEVWGGLLAAFALERFVIRPLADTTDSRISCNISNSIFPLAAFSVGIGEEALFRGYLQSYYAERMGPTGAIISSSIVFGLAHVPNIFLGVDNTGTVLIRNNWREYLTYGIPFITAFGGYFGWLTHKNHSLKNSVAIHAWYDFALFLEDAVTSAAIPMVTGGDPQFAFSFEF